MKYGKKTPLPKRRPRLVARDNDGFHVVRIGHKRFWLSDLYVELLQMPWSSYFLIIILVYFFSNYLFAEIYFLNRAGVENARPDSFLDMYFFSVQTMATIGYGRLAPVNFITNAVVTVEALWGFTFFAFIAALAFARFSRPKARVLFSNIAVISDYDGKPHLKLRLANQRTNRIVDVNVDLVILREAMTKEGYRMRRFEDLPLTRSHVPLLQLTWTLMHPIDKNSPLWGMTQEKLRESGDELIISISGYDESLSQQIFAQHSYMADEIICEAFFEDILSTREDGTVQVDYNLFHSYKRACD